MVVNRVTLVSATPADADHLSQRYVNATIASYGSSLEEAFDEMALVGTPDQVSTRLQRYVAAGATHVFARLSLDEMPPEVARSTIQLMGREVIPQFTERRVPQAR